jgi:hypothetical protein
MLDIFITNPSPHIANTFQELASDPALFEQLQPAKQALEASMPVQA